MCPDEKKKRKKVHWTANWDTTKLVFRIDDISVEFEEQICQQLILYKIVIPMTYIDILGLFISTSYTKK